MTSHIKFILVNFDCTKVYSEQNRRGVLTTSVRKIQLHKLGKSGDCTNRIAKRESPVWLSAVLTRVQELKIRTLAWKKPQTVKAGDFQDALFLVKTSVRNRQPTVLSWDGWARNLCVFRRKNASNHPRFVRFVMPSQPRSLPFTVFKKQKESWEIFSDFDGWWNGIPRRSRRMSPSWWAPESSKTLSRPHHFLSSLGIDLLLVYDLWWQLRWKAPSFVVSAENPT